MVLRDSAPDPTAHEPLDPDAPAVAKKKRKRVPSPVLSQRKRIQAEAIALLEQAKATIEVAVADGRTDAIMAHADHAVAVLRAIPTLAATVEQRRELERECPPLATAFESTTRNKTLGELWSREGLDLRHKQGMAKLEEEEKFSKWRAEGKCGRCGSATHKTSNSKECIHFKARVKKPKAAPAPSTAFQPINAGGSATNSFGHR